MKRTEISALGKVAFVERLTEPFTTDLDSRIRQGIGDDAAVIDRGGWLEVVSQATMLEGIDFDLTYTPLEHLGYKLVVAAVSNICAMNARAEYLTVSIGLSARFSVEDATALYDGIKRATDQYGLSLIGGNTSASLTGLNLTAAVIGSTTDEELTLRSGARNKELLCVTGNLGAAYLGLQLLEREKRVLAGNDVSRPEINEEHAYILQRQLKPEARVDVLRQLREAKIRPTAMIDVTRGLASAALHLCRRSEVGVRIYLNRIPIASQTFKMAEEMRIDPVVAALNGGDDFELLFTAPLDKHQELLTMSGVDVIGHIVPASEGAALVTPDGGEIRLQAPDWTARVEAEGAE
ncbi:MAG: thiamine-phosphate kinase [Rikenella sp.]|nr:thiamine-phosphate kinase [Rikenella sp.]